MSMTNVVYVIYTDHGFVYVGSTQELQKRIDRHIRDLKNGNHHCLGLQEAYNLGSELSHKFWFCADRLEAYDREQAMMDYYREKGMLLNIGLQSKGGDNLTLHPRREDIITRIKEAMRETLDKMTEDERKAKYGRMGELNGMFGKTHTSEVRSLLSEIMKGNTNRLGYKASDETRARLSEIASARVGESNPFYGKQHSEETRKRIASMKMGIKPTNTHRVEIDGVEYGAQAEAAKSLGVAPATITYRIRSANPMYSGYRVIK